MNDTERFCTFTLLVSGAYKALRTNVAFSLTEEACRTVLVTSAMASEGKSITALNLSISFAEAGERVE